MATASATGDESVYLPFLRKLKILSAGGMFLDGFDLTVIAVALPLIVKRFHIGAGIEGVVAASAVVGLLVGALVMGPFTDRFGRRTMYLLDLVFFVVFAVLAALSQNVWELLVFRFLLGFGIGADYAISTTLVAEFSPQRVRGTQVSFLNVTWGVGALAAYVAGIAMINTGPNAWRYMLMIGAVIALIVLAFRRGIPESPRWLQSEGRGEQARDVVTSVPGAPEELLAKSDRFGWRDIFSPRYLRTTVFISVFWFCFVVAFYGISLYTPTVIKTFGLVTQLQADIGAAIIGVADVVGNIIGLLMVDRWGRRRPTILGFAGLTVPIVILALLPHVNASVIVLLFLIAILLVSLGPGIMNFVYTTELYPTTIRAGAMGFGTAVSRVGSILGVVLFPVLIGAWGFSAALWLFAVVGVIGLVITWAMAPETKHQQLEVSARGLAAS